MEENVTEQEMGFWFKQYLNETFGENFDSIINSPKGVRYGERLMYKYKNNAEATRHETTQEDLDEFNKVTEDIARKVGCSYIPAVPPVTSGLPFPRVVDLKEASILWEIPMKEYMDSEEALPEKNFGLEWLLGLCFGSNKKLLYLDFTHPIVKGIFSFEYELESVFSNYGEAGQQFVDFNCWIDSYKKHCDSFDHFRWVKVSQQDSRKTIIVRDK